MPGSGRFRKEKLTPLVGDKVEFDKLDNGKGILKVYCRVKMVFASGCCKHGYDDCSGFKCYSGDRSVPY